MPLVFPGVGIADCRTFAGVVDIGRVGGLGQKRMARSDNSKSSWRMQGTLTSHDARPLPQPRSTRRFSARQSRCYSDTGTPSKYRSTIIPPQTLHRQCSFEDPLSSLTPLISHLGS